MDNHAFFYYTIPVNTSAKGGHFVGKRKQLKLTPCPARKRKDKAKVVSRPAPEGKQWYGVSYEGKPTHITLAQDSETAVRNCYFAKLRQQQKRLSFSDAVAKMKTEVLSDPADWKGKIKAPKRKVKWQVCRNSRPLKTTMAVSEAQARDNGWYAKFRSKEEPVREETKRIYHDQISAKPVFGQEKPKASRRRKVSHLGQPNLFPH